MDPGAFQYELPKELIAQAPPEERDGARMLVLHRGERRWEDRRFRELPAYLGAGDCLALNDSRVFPARLLGRRAGVRSLPIGKRNPKRREHLSRSVEALLLRPADAEGRVWEALMRPGRRLRLRERIRFEGGLGAEIVGRGEFGLRTLRFDLEGDPYAAFERLGHAPLPPYIRRPDTPADRERYQTVFARETGSAAAPTAGLHFTPETLAECRARGAATAYLTLHVGLGTFQPLRAEQLASGRLHAERYRLTEEAAAAMRAAKRLLAVGTTSVRVIETVMRDGPLRAASGETDLFIYPGFEFRGAGAMLTNFHLPGSSLLMLVCAFAGTELALAAYRHAVEARYRFYSYGDCMLIV